MKRLKKLVGISLQEITPDPAMISRLLTAASRNLSDAGVVEISNALRRQRNVVDYSGDLIPESAIIECVSQAEYLIKKVHDWISTYYPELNAG